MAALIFGYFGTQAFKGEYGISANIRLQNKAVVLEKELIVVTKKRNILEKRVALLRNGTIEKDMLDEQVRRNLGMVDKDDVVLLRWFKLRFFDSSPNC